MKKKGFEYFFFSIILLMLLSFQGDCLRIRTDHECEKKESADSNFKLKAHNHTKISKYDSPLPQFGYKTSSQIENQVQRKDEKQARTFKDVGRFENQSKLVFVKEDIKKFNPNDIDRFSQ